MIKRSKMRNNWIYIILTLTVAFFAISAFTYYDGNRHIDELSKNFGEFYIREKKLDLKTEVDSRHDEITYELAGLQDDYNERVKSKIEAVASAMRTHAFADEIPCEEQRECFIKTFEEYVAHDPGYAYFAVSPEGILLRSGIDYRVVGEDISDAVDSDGVYYTREIMKAADHPEGVYVTYRWPKVKGGEPLKKTSYCYYMEEFDLIIGTGAYEEDVLKELEERIYDRLQSYYEGKENYIFVNDYDGITYVHVRSEGRGYDFSTYVDVNGLNVHDAFMDVVETEGNGYVNYYIRRRSGDSTAEEVSEKISYVRRIEGWDVYIGMGFHTYQLEDAIGQFVHDFHDEHLSSMFVTIGLLLLTALLLLYLVRRGYLMQSEYMKQGDIIYEQVLNMSYDLVVVLNDKGKIVFVNKDVPDDVHLEAFIERNQLVFKPVKDSVHAIEGIDNTYYVELKEDSCYYHGEAAKIYYIKDITAQYEEVNLMETLALHDVLTGLPNRRKLTKDIMDKCKGDCDICNMVLSIFDIDHFKEINDTYGHDFGDHVLKDLAAYVSRQLRPGDSIYRYGGEEFVIIFREYDLESAKTWLEGINEEFYTWMKKRYDVDLTFSGGVVYCQCNRYMTTIDSRLKKADELLYEAKRQGRNRILVETNESMTED